MGSSTTAAEKKEKLYTEEYEDEQDPAIQLAPHLAKRKQKIDRAKASENERAALKLPPSYDDIDFSDDERLV